MAQVAYDLARRLQSLERLARARLRLIVENDPEAGLEAFRLEAPLPQTIEIGGPQETVETSAERGLV